MEYFTYIAQCADKTLYTGYCKDVKEREKAHNEGEGAKYTRGRRPVKIIYFEEYKTRGEAISRENQIKKWGREKKINLVKYSHSTKF